MPFVFELLDSSPEVYVYLSHGRIDLLLCGDEEVGRVNDESCHRAVFASALWVEGGDALDLIVPEGDAVGYAVETFDGGEDIDGVALDTEVARGEGQTVIDVVVEYQIALELLLTVSLSLLQAQDLLLKSLWVSHTVEAGDGGDDDDVFAPREEGGGCPQAELLDLGIDGHILLDIGIGGGDIGFGLVVIVVGDEVLDSIVGEERLELGIELGCQGLVVTQYQRGLAEASDDVGSGEGLPRPRDPK